MVYNRTPFAATNEDLVDRVKQLLREVQFQDYSFHVRSGHGGVFIQAIYMDDDIYTRKRTAQYTRKWLVSPKMTDSEIVQTVFKLCHTSFEHRCREYFLFKGARIFGPHFDVNDLVQICDKGRDNAGGRDEQGTNLGEQSTV